MTFSQFSGESDSQYGSNDWSIQLNSNYFTGNNGHQDAVQFIEFNYPSRCWGACGYAQVCIQQWDATTGTLDRNQCMGTNQQGLNNGYSATEYGYLSQSGGTNYVNAQFCDNTGKCWGTVDTDVNGLAGRWSDASGTILGLANGSTANFSHPTSLSTFVEVLAPTYFSGYSENYVITREANNLNAGTASLSCGHSISFYCATTTPSTN